MDIPESLSGKAISLRDLGLHEIAWRRREALLLLDHWTGSDVFVLGGDVLEKTPEGYRHNYDSWHFDRSRGSALESIEIARSYILDYPGGDYVFVLVGQVIPRHEVD